METETITIGIVTYTREGNGPWTRTVDEAAKAEIIQKIKTKE